MSGKVSHSTLEEIRAGNDIADVIGSYFNLQNKGAVLKALCPFHKEKTPSFVVNRQRQIFHCFGCGAGGDVFRFIMDYEKVDFPTAIRMLAQRSGIRLAFDDHETPHASGKDVIYEILEQAALWYHAFLRKKSEAGAAREYLHSRRLSQDAIDAFRIGFAPDRWDGFLNWAARKYDTEQLEAAGLILGSRRDAAVSNKARNQESRHYYDRFRNRILFPVHDEQGRVVGFSARSFSGRDEGAKYINSPETVVFHKSRVLYGLHMARREIARAREVLVCEGQLDVIRCHMAGFKNAVAPQGTALSDEHARMLNRYADTALLVFDADQAGRQAALRSADIMIRIGMAVRVAELPSGEDPDSLLQGADGSSVFQKILDNAKSALDFHIDLLVARENIDAETGLLRAVSEVLEMIERAPNAVQRDMLIKRAAERMGLKEASLRADFVKKTAKSRFRPEKEQDASPVLPKQPLKEVALVEHLAADPSLADLVRAYLPVDLLSDPLCVSMVRAAIESSETGEDMLSIISRNSVNENELMHFAARIFAAPPKAEAAIATHEDCVKSLILRIRTDALMKRRKELADVQAARENGKISAARLKELELEYCQLGYDIANLKTWETAVPVMENMGDSAK